MQIFFIVLFVVVFIFSIGATVVEPAVVVFFVIAIGLFVGLIDG